MIPDDQELTDLVHQLDTLIMQYEHIGNHNLAGVLLSRVTLLMRSDPETGKGLCRYVWEKLDEMDPYDNP